ncbi:MAG: VOC family protein [Myxococcota bacterium]
MENPSILNHVSLGTNDFDRALAFYDELLKTLGCRRIMEHPGAVAWGKQFPEFWVQTPFDGKQAAVGNGTHISFMANNKEEVHAFFETAIANGALPDGEPGPRPQYTDAYYGCFVRDLDGHKIEATYWDATKL